MFLDGLAFIIFKTFSLCKHIAELDLKKTKTRSQQNVVVIDNSFEEVNSVSSEYSSRTSEDFVVTSWDQNQVKKIRLKDRTNDCTCLQS